MERQTTYRVAMPPSLPILANRLAFTTYEDDAMVFASEAEATVAIEWTLRLVARSVAAGLHLTAERMLASELWVVVDTSGTTGPPGKAVYLAGFSY